MAIFCFSVYNLIVAPEDLIRDGTEAMFMTDIIKLNYPFSIHIGFSEETIMALGEGNTCETQ